TPACSQTTRSTLQVPAAYDWLWPCQSPLPLVPTSATAPPPTRPLSACTASSHGAGSGPSAFASTLRPPVTPPHHQRMSAAPAADGRWATPATPARLPECDANTRSPAAAPRRSTTAVATACNRHTAPVVVAAGPLLLRGKSGTVRLTH